MHSGEMLPSRHRRIPSIRAHVLYTLETWSFHVSVLLNISPRCLCLLTWGMGNCSACSQEGFETVETKRAHEESFFAFSDKNAGENPSFLK